MTIDSINNNIQYNNSNERAQIEKEIKALTKQMEQVQKDEQISPEVKMKKIMAIQAKITILQGRIAQSTQKAPPSGNTEKAGKAEKNSDSTQHYDRLELSSEYMNIHSTQKQQKTMQISEEDNLRQTSEL